MNRILMCSRDYGVEFRRVPAIKAVRGLTGKGLKESKEFVESLVNSPESIIVDNDLLDNTVRQYISDAATGGVTIAIKRHSTPVRREIASQLQTVLSYCTLAGEFDVAKQIINVMEMHLPIVNSDEDDSI